MAVMMQYFHWYVKKLDPCLWEELAQKAQELKDAGIDALWLPPVYKGSAGDNDVGYSTYDLYDLGEFDQKGTVRTKYGTKEQLVEAIAACKRVGLGVYLDTVFNHKFGADEMEMVEARPVDWDDRTRIVGDYKEIGAYTKFDFPGRKGKYSDFVWTHEHFDAIDYDGATKEQHIYLLKGKEFEEDLDHENGNYDYLMGADLDMQHPDVRRDLERWGEWILDTLDVDGFRLDAIKHISGAFFRDWMAHISAYSKAKRDGKSAFFVGEYLSSDVGAMQSYLEDCGRRMHMFDFKLHFNFHEAAVANEAYDMRRIFDGSLVQADPVLAVTFVENHDTQPGQAFGANAIPENFKTLAYALILLRKEGYPCVFYADYYGAEYEEPKDNKLTLASHQVFINHLLHARKHYMKGECYNYFNQQSILGWAYRGDETQDKAMAVVLSNGAGGSERMEVCRPSGTVFKDITGTMQEEVHVGDDGWADFPVGGKAVCVWVQQ